MSTRESVLGALAAADDYISGEALARELGTTRSAVWKAIAQLKAEGLQISAVTNRGYRLEDEPVTEAGIRRWLTARTLGSVIEVHDALGSTNDRAKELAQAGAAHGTLVCAREQRSGRGRFGRRFDSPKGSGAWFSLVLRPSLPAGRAVLLTVMAAVAVAQAIERVAGIDTAIKWVNDVYVDGKKTCGILCEASLDLESGCLDHAVAGIGINTAPRRFPPELSDIATSVGNACGRDVSKNRIIAEVLNRLEALSAGTEQDLLEEYRRRSNVIGRRVTVLRGDERFSALAVGIDDEGSLVVETEAGRMAVRSGEISIRWEEEKR